MTMFVSDILCMCDYSSESLYLHTEFIRRNTFHLAPRVATKASMRTPFNVCGRIGVCAECALHMSISTWLRLSDMCTTLTLDCFDQAIIYIV